MDTYGKNFFMYSFYFELYKIPSSKATFSRCEIKDWNSQENSLPEGVSLINVSRIEKTVVKRVRN